MDEKVIDKKERLLAALDLGVVMVHLDARRPGVVVPDHLLDESHLRLNISFRYEPFDLSVGDWGLRTTLSFSGKRFTVAVPWSSLFAISSHVSQEHSWLYPDDMPPELLQQTLVVPAEPPKEERRKSRKKRAVSPVKAVPPVPSDDAVVPEPEVSTPSPDDEPKPRARGHLRLVK